ncbi:MAG: hypothetical protein ABSE95_14805 [Thermodesulfobacteriota bacterium]
MNVVKSFGAVLGILVVSLFLFQGCNSSTGSSGSGLIQQRVQVIPAVSSLKASDVTNSNLSSTFITVIVKDSNGNFVPAGTPVTITCGAGFLGNVNSTDLVSSITVTTDSNGMVQVRYTAGYTTGTATISAVSQGNSGSATITIT